MSVNGTNVWVFLGVASLALAGCVTTDSRLNSSAERLEHATYELQAQARYDGGSSYSHDAQELAREAHDFNRVVDDRRTDGGDMREAFHDLSERYHAMRDEVERSSSREAERDFQPVTDAYLDVEREMRGYEDHDRRRYAHDDY